MHSRASGAQLQLQAVADPLAAEPGLLTVPPSALEATSSASPNQAALTSIREEAMIGSDCAEAGRLCADAYPGFGHQQRPCTGYWARGAACAAAITGASEPPAASRLDRASMTSASCQEEEPDVTHY